MLEALSVVTTPDGKYCSHGFDSDPVILFINKKKLLIGVIQGIFKENYWVNTILLRVQKRFDPRLVSLFLLAKQNYNLLR